MGAIITGYVVRVLMQLSMAVCFAVLFWIIVPVITKKPIKNDKPVKVKVILLVAFITVCCLLHMVKF